MNTAEHFEGIVREHYDGLFRFAMSLTRSETDAQDLTQQTFCVWATKGHQLRDVSKAKTWLFTTLHRAFLESRRRQNKFSQYALDEIDEQSPAYTPEVVNQADAAEVLAALAKVDGVYQAAVALFYLDECPYREIAEILEVPVGTVKSRIARGIAQLRDILLSDGVRDPLSDKEKVSSLPGRGALTPPREDGCPVAQCAVAPRLKDAGSDYADWEFGSTLLPERFSPA